MHGKKKKRKEKKDMLYQYLMKSLYISVLLYMFLALYVYDIIVTDSVTICYKQQVK